MANRYRTYAEPAPLLLGYDPVRDLPSDHLARFIDEVVDQVPVPDKVKTGQGQPPYHPRLCLKVLLYAYATGVRSSRLVAQACRESLPYLYLTRGDHPSHTALNTFRREHSDLVEQAWVVLFTVADDLGLKRIGRITVDTMKLRANASRESVVEADEYEIVLQVLREILAEADAADEREDREGFGGTQVGQPVEKVQMREVLRRARKRLRMDKKAGAKGKEELSRHSGEFGGGAGAEEEQRAPGWGVATAQEEGPAEADGPAEAGDAHVPGGDSVEEGSVGASAVQQARSEERRVGKECRSRWSPYH